MRRPEKASGHTDPDRLPSLDLSPPPASQGDSLVSVGLQSSGTPFPDALTYALPAHLRAQVAFGSTLLVPLGARELIGAAVGFPEQPPADLRLRPILAVLDPTPAFDERLYHVAEWMATRYHSPLGEALQRIMPESHGIQAERVLRLSPDWPDDDTALARWGASTRNAVARIRRLLVEAGGEIEIAELKRRFPTPALSTLLRQLRTRGWIQDLYLLRLPRVRARTVITWSLAPSLASPSERQSEAQPDESAETTTSGVPEGQPNRAQAFMPGNGAPALTSLGAPLGDRTAEDPTSASAVKPPALGEPPDQAASPPRLGERQQRVLEFLSSQPGREFPQPDLCRTLGVTPSVLQSLERRGLLRAGETTLNRAARVPLAPAPAPCFTPDQAAAAAVLDDAVRRRAAERFLLFGVTGSGKTELYMRAMEQALAVDRQAIFLVPEISLTAQVAASFRARFGERVAILHSRLSDGERYDEWQRIRRGEADVVVGARSALFAPTPDPGVIALDEEHDPSYKQDSSPRYVTRAVAEQRASLTGCPVIMGSATPAVETFYRAGTGELRRLDLPRRVHDRPLPEVRVVDLRAEFRCRGASVFSADLKEAISERLARDEQVILFVNRRGFSAFILCRDCGFVPRCPRCNVSLTFHAAAFGTGRLVCHHCGHERRAPQSCPRCAGTRIRHFGIGTQKVEEAARDLFPEARLARLDRDTTTTKDSHARIVAGFKGREADILIGTQMVAKGFDFPHVTLVGIITADTALNLPDFRAAERTFQLLTQVAGRAGRGEVPGEVILQTFTPEHYAVRAAMHHDYLTFYQEEILTREELCYPPFSSLARLVATDPHADAAHGRIDMLRSELAPQAHAAGIELLGPTMAPLARLRGKYRWHLLLKSASDAKLQALIAETLPRLRRLSGWYLDVDPVSLM